MSSGVKTILFWIFVFICLMLLWGVVQRSILGTGKNNEISYSDLFDEIDEGQVQDVTIQGAEFRGHLKSNPKAEFHTIIPNNYEDLERALLTAKVNFSFKEPQNNISLPLFFSIGPVILVGAMCFFMLRRIQLSGNNACLVWDAIFTLQKAGLENEAARLRCAIGK